jgi:hypothetical protein
MDGEATGELERVGVAEGAEPATADASADEAPRSLTLAQRLAQIRSGAFGIGKDNIKMSYIDKKTGDRKEFSIKGHTVEAVLSEMRPLLDNAGVLLVPSLVERTYAGNRCDVLVDFEWENLDDATDRRTVRWAGAGTDDGDKGFSKAGTNALKEHLKKLFLITDRDDAKEEEDKVDHKPEGAAGRAEVEKAKEVAARALQQWATTFKSALESASTAKEIDRLRQDSADQLADENLPTVTRQFFFDLIQRRKSELPK